MYAVVETGGKQYRVSEKDQIFVEKLNGEEGKEVILDKVLAVGKEGDVKLGEPYVKGAKVSAKVLKNGKSKKVVVFTYKPKKDSKRKMGHRQAYTKLEIQSITVG